MQEVKITVKLTKKERKYLNLIFCILKDLLKQVTNLPIFFHIITQGSVKTNDHWPPAHRVPKDPRIDHYQFTLKCDILENFHNHLFPTE